MLHWRRGSNRDLASLRIRGRTWRAMVDRRIAAGASRPSSAYCTHGDASADHDLGGTADSPQCPLYACALAPSIDSLLAGEQPNSATVACSGHFRARSRIALLAFLVFCGHVVYRPYLSGDHGMFGLSPLDDQALAGALMWVTVTFAYLIPALVLTARLLSSERTRASEVGV